CIYSSFAAQLSRSIVSRGWDRGELERRMGAQLPVEEKILRADFVLGNCGTLLQLERQVQLLLERIV
ncbi:MAG: dephospho-CoA kinase, partial [Puniceicoccales bacterium]|nr:dephospho-CoA kinase [Puniceicoccales bacterium]